MKQISEQGKNIYVGEEKKQNENNLCESSSSLPAYPLFPMPE